MAWTRCRYSNCLGTGGNGLEQSSPQECVPELPVLMVSISSGRWSRQRNECWLHDPFRRPGKFQGVLWMLKLKASLGRQGSCFPLIMFSFSMIVGCHREILVSVPLTATYS